MSSSPSSSSYPNQTAPNTSPSHLLPALKLPKNHPKYDSLKSHHCRNGEFAIVVTEDSYYIPLIGGKGSHGGIIAEDVPHNQEEASTCTTSTTPEKNNNQTTHSQLPQAAASSQFHHPLEKSLPQGVQLVQYRFKHHSPSAKSLPSDENAPKGSSNVTAKRKTSVKALFSAKWRRNKLAKEPKKEPPLLPQQEKQQPNPQPPAPSGEESENHHNLSDDVSSTCSSVEHEEDTPPADSPYTPPSSPPQTDSILSKMRMEYHSPRRPNSPRKRSHAVHNRVHLQKAAVHPNATVTGNVSIGENSVVGSGVRIIASSRSGGIKIGRNNIIKSNVTIINEMPNSTLIIGESNLFETGARVYWSNRRLDYTSDFSFLDVQSGVVHIGDQNSFGMKSAVYCSVGSFCCVAPHAEVMQDVSDHGHVSRNGLCAPVRLSESELKKQRLLSSSKSKGPFLIHLTNPSHFEQLQILYRRMQQNESSGMVQQH